MTTRDIGAILAGGASVCAAAGVPVAGGHSIDSAEPIYGLVALGLVRPDRVRRNSDGRAGDALILTKPLGVGVLSAALRRGELDPRGYAALLDVTTRLNTVGATLAEIDAVHAITDVTGFGLLGHLLEVCRGSRLAAEVDADAVPFLPEVRRMVERGVVTGASARNWASYGDAVRFDGPNFATSRDLLCDPQTSGGLLVSVAQAAVADVLAQVRGAGFAEAAVIGRLVEGPPGVDVRG